MGKFMAREGNDNIKHCAFCVNFFDPTCSCISPVPGQPGRWFYEANEKRQCKVLSREWSSSGTCKQFKCKL